MLRSQLQNLRVCVLASFFLITLPKTQNGLKSFSDLPADYL